MMSQGVFKVLREEVEEGCIEVWEVVQFRQRIN